MMNVATMPQNPDTFRIKSNTPTTNGDDLTKRVTLVDTLHPNKEKKLLFEKVEYEDEYYPFGTPGNYIIFSFSEKLKLFKINIHF